MTLSMTKNPSRMLPEVFVLNFNIPSNDPNTTFQRVSIFILTLMPQIRMHFGEWEVVVVCHPKERVSISVSIFPRVIQLHFSQWEAIVVCRPRRGVELLKEIDIFAMIIV